MRLSRPARGEGLQTCLKGVVCVSLFDGISVERVAFVLLSRRAL